MEKYDWKTPKGAKIEIEVSQEHTEVVDADGDKVEVVKQELKLESLKVNDKEYEGKISGRKVVFKMKGRKAAANIPEEIYNIVMQPTLDRWEAERKTSADYEKSHNSVTKAMNY